VSISETNTSALIYYTTDGTAPTTASAQYSSPVSVSSTMTLRALAVAGTQSSTVTTGSYTIADGTTPATGGPAPTFYPAPGTFAAVQSVKMSDANTAAALYYTTDGSKPTTSSARYATPLSISTSMTLQAIAVVGQQTSAITSGTYTISLPPAKLGFVSQPTDSTTGAVVAPAVTVAVLDGNGNRVSSSGQTVSVTLQQNGKAATMGGTTSSTSSYGLATFNNLVVNGSGSGFALTATVQGLPTAQSAGFTVVPQLPSEQAAQADSFVDSIGVQTHISYVDTAYGQWAKVLSGIQTLGVRHIRDGLPTTSAFLSNFQQLAAAGVHCMCGFALPNSLSATQIAGFVQLAQNADGLEAPNECDAGSNCGGGGLTGIANVVAFLPILNTASKASSLAAVGPSFQTKLGYTSSGNIASLINYNNLHIYFGGRNPGSGGWGEGDAQGHFYGSFDWWIDQGNVNAPGSPDLVTETGYLAYPSATQTGTIPESVEASYTPRTLLIAFTKGIKRTYLYELVDESADTGYGLLANDFSAKPAYTAVKNLIGTLKDPGSSFTAAKLNYSVSGNTNTMQHLLLQKRDGSYWLVLWLEQSSYDSTNVVSTKVTPQNVTLSIGAGTKLGELVQFDTSGNATTTALPSGDYATPLTLSDQVTIVQVQPR
jgi:hypothetical protein